MHKWFKKTLSSSLPLLPYGEGCAHLWALLGCSGLADSCLPLVLGSLAFPLEAPDAALGFANLLGLCLLSI